MIKYALQTNMKQFEFNILTLAGGGIFGYLHSVVDLSSKLPKPNPPSARKDDLNPGAPDYKSSARVASGILKFDYVLGY